MGTTTATLTGHGSAFTNGGSDVTYDEIATKVTTAGDLVSFDGPAGYARIHHAGWIGLGGYPSDSPPPELITFSRFLAHEFESIKPVGGLTFGTKYLWDLSPGTTVDIELNWH